MREYRIYVNDNYYGKTPIEEQAKKIVNQLRKQGKEVEVKIQDAFGVWRIDATM